MKIADTLYDLITYTNPQNNLLLGSQFMTNKLFELKYDLSHKWCPYKSVIITPNMNRNCINYDLPFHVFISDNTGDVISISDTQFVILEFKQIDREMLYLRDEISIEINGTRLKQKAYGAFVDANIDTYQRYTKDKNVVTLYITLLKEIGNGYKI